MDCAESAQRFVRNCYNQNVWRRISTNRAASCGAQEAVARVQQAAPSEPYSIFPSHL
jgi:hypothetical protein